MKLRCIDVKPSPEEITRLGSDYYQSQRFDVKRGRIYVPITMLFHRNSPALGTGCSAGIAIDDRYLHYVPLMLFDVLDATLPALWQIGVYDEGDRVLLAPESMHQPYYDSMLADGFPKVRKDFHQILEALGALNPD